MSARLKRNLGMLVATAIATAVLSMVAVAVLPGRAEAQNAQEDTPNARTADRDAGITAPEGRPETRAVVEPGDSLWSVAQERLGPNAPPESVAREVGQIFELNRERIGESPDLIFPGQELALTPEEAPATAEAPAASEAVPEVVPAVAAETVPVSVPASDQPPAEEAATEEAATEEAAAAAETPAPAEPAYETRNVERRATGLWVLALTLLAMLATTVLATRRSLGARRRSHRASEGYYDPYAWSRYRGHEEKKRASGNGATSPPTAAEPVEAARREGTSKPSTEPAPKIPTPEVTAASGTGNAERRQGRAPGRRVAARSPRGGW